jgi:predicted Fe-Mo cluster-binding NifX family protein
MKIAVTSTGPTLDDAVETRFGRCAYFLIIDPDTMEFEALSNPNITLGGGAGIQSAQLMADKGVAVVLTGNCGPNAFQTFGATGIQIITAVNGQVCQAVQQYKAGTLAVTKPSNEQSQISPNMGGAIARVGDIERGMGGGMRGGMGRGMGRGMGGGGGKGCGRRFR